MRYAVTGASGQLGRLVTAKVLDAVDPGDVVLVSRSPEELDPRGAEVRTGDFDRPETLDKAFAGVDRLLIVSTNAVGTRLAGQRAAIDAAVRAGVGHVVYTSVTAPVPANPAGVVPDHAGTEDALRASGLGWTSLRNNLYSDLQVPALAQAARDGVLYTNTGEGRAAYVTREDCAAVAAAALLRDDAGSGALDVTGPEALSGHDLAALAGPQVRVVDLGDDAFRESLVTAGMPAAFAGLYASFGTAIREGYLAAVAPTVADLTGRPATSLADLLAAAGRT